MAPALIVAALLARGAIDNPAVLAVPPARHAQGLALVARLGDRQFAEREAAACELEGMGRLALGAVRAGRKSADAEVRLRCERLQPAMETEELAAQLAVFVADAAGRYEHRVPGWELFRAAAGDDRPARDLFADISRNRDNWQLLAALRGPGVDIRPGLLAAAGGAGVWSDRPSPVRAAQAGGFRRWEFLAAQEAPPAVGADDDAPPANRPQPTVSEVALVILAETLHPERMVVGGRLLPKDFVNSYFAANPGFTALKGEGKYGPAFARLGRVWMDTRDGPGVSLAYARAKSLELDPPTLCRYAARVVGQPTAPAEVRAECLGRLVEGKAVEHLGLILGRFADTEPLGGGLLRDHLLAAAVDLTGQKRADYGLGGGPPVQFVVPEGTEPKDVGKVVGELRTAAFARWRDWEATRFGAVAGPTVVAGNRPGG